MDKNAGIRQRPRCAPLVIPPLGSSSEALPTDVDGAESLMDGLTIVPSVNAVLSLSSVTSSTPAMFTGDRGPSFATRSGGPRGDISVLSALSAPTYLLGRESGGVAGVIGGTSGGGQSGILGGVGTSSARTLS